MNANTKKLHDLGQSVWVDNISREMLIRGVLVRYIADWSVTGLTSNPTIFEHAIADGSFYDEAIARLARRGEGAEESFYALDLSVVAAQPAADFTIERIGDLADFDLSPLIKRPATEALATLKAP